MAKNTYFFPIWLIAILLILCITACTKKSDSGDAAKFVGTWTGTSACTTGGASGALVFNPGSDANSVTMIGTVGTTSSCLKAIALNAKAIGNTLTFPSQSFTDNCGLPYTISGTGTLSGATLTITQEYTGSITASCTFTGHK